MKILYLMHVDKAWIKQRPHFIAEELSKKINLCVFYQYSFRRRNLINSDNNFKNFPFVLPPFFFKSSAVRALYSLLLKFFFKVIISVFDPKFIWISHPFQYNFFFKNDQKKLIYDCMDDHVEFFESKTLKNEIFQLENKISNYSYKVICSSSFLYKKFNKSKNNIFKVFNAYSKSSTFCNLNSSLNTRFNHTNNPIICYFGTLSNWIDYDSIAYVLNNNKFITIRLIGPVDLIPKNIKNHKRIQLISPKAHNDLLNFIDDVSIFIIPFIVNNLIRSVDPVKMYEYIVCNKPIIARYYPELRKFSEFVDFYNDKTELISLINEYTDINFRPKFSEKKRNLFLKTNSWENRAEEILNIIQE